MAEDPEDEGEPLPEPRDPWEAALDLERAAEALGEEPEDLLAAFDEAGVDPDELASALTGAEPEVAVESLAETLDRSEASVAVGLADAVEIQEDDLVQLMRGLGLEPGDLAAEIRRAHLEDLVREVDAAGWIPWERKEEPPTLQELAEAARQAERRILAGGLFVASLLVAFGMVMFNAPPLLREILWVVLGALLVAAGLGLVVALVRLSDLSKKYIARFESLSDEFEEDSVSVVTSMAQQASLGRRAQEAAMRKAWRLFQEARADDEAPDGEPDGEPADPAEAKPAEGEPGDEGPASED